MSPAPAAPQRPPVSFKLDIAADQRVAPAAPRVRSRRKTSRASRTPRRAALWLSAVIAGIAIATALKSGAGGITDEVAGRLPPLTDVAQAVGLGLDQVAITGHRFTSDEAVFKALDLKSARSLAGFDSKAARERIEALPWVAQAELTRVYPSQLNVYITERKAFALWRNDKREQLIDETGRVLQDVPPGSVTHLPVIVGEAAESAAKSLMVLLGRYAALAGAFKWADRVNGRRWSVHLANGGRVELPADGEALALAELEATGRLDKLLAGAPLVIDLRAPGRIAFRPVDPKAASAAQRNIAGIGSLIEAIQADGRAP